VALLLRKNGITRVRPLAGGLEGWRERSFPLQALDLAGIPAATLADAG